MSSASGETPRRFRSYALPSRALLALFGCGPQEAPRVPLQAYPYYFYEQTGPNKFVMINGIEHNFTFDLETSEPDALEALRALKWNVVYPNAEGNIMLIGTYLPDQGTFSLQHWTLEAPFVAYFGENPLEATPFLITRKRLIPDDFNHPISHDPRIYHHTIFEEQGVSVWW
jgi:hypothetical protein